MFDPMDRNAIRLIRILINEALAGKVEGAEVEAGNATYDANSVTFKVKFTRQGFDASEVEFKRYATLMGVKPEDYRRKFTSGGTEYRLAGINPGRPKYPFTAQRVSDAKMFKFPLETVKAAFARQPA